MAPYFIRRWRAICFSGVYVPSCILVRVLLLCNAVLMFSSAATHSHAHMIRTRVVRAVFIVTSIVFNVACLVVFALIVRAGLIFPEPGDPGFFALYYHYFTVLACFFMAMDVFTAGAFVYYGKILAEYMRNFPVGSVTAKSASARKVHRYYTAV